MRRLTVLGYLHKFLPFLYIVFFISLFCGLRAVSSTCVGAFIFFTLLINRLQDGRFFARPVRNSFVTGCLVYYLLLIIALAYTHNLPAGLGHMQIKITLVFIPLALYYSNYLNVAFREKVMPFYTLFMALSMVFCLGAATIRYSETHDPSVFFYYALISPFHHHAIQFSILAYIGLIYLLERLRKGKFILNKLLHFIAIIFFIFFILLLSSKMVISFSLFSLLFYAGLSIKKSYSRKRIFFLSVIVSFFALMLLMAVNNPVSRRFKDIFEGNVSVIEQRQFNPGEYFNGLQFRLLQWRLVTEILTEHKTWVKGVSPGDAQHLLDEKYRSMHMYLGDPAGESQGFLGYNTHNEFLESVLQLGVVGLAVFLLIFTGCIQMLFRSNCLEFWFVGTILLCYCFVESVFETQYGVLLFSFFPLFFYFSSPGSGREKTSVSNT